MAYELKYSDFLKIIKNKDLQKELLKIKLPDDAFFGDPEWKEGKKVKFNAQAKTSEENIKFLEKKFKTKSVQLNLDISNNGFTVRFIKSRKTSNSSRNSLGKKLSDAGELGTVLSLTKDILTPSDTGQKIFIENVQAFSAWFLTFKYTKLAVQKIVKNINSYNILHDATDTSEFTKVIELFCKKIKMSKDSWNPADIFIISKSRQKEITKSLEDIVKKYEIKDNLIQIFNNKIYDLYKEKLLYPISLKQLRTDKPKIEFTNEPVSNEAHNYDIEILNFNLNLSSEGKEIGLFTFKNNDTNKIISLQVRGFPHGYGISQMEITSDGTVTGGRLGKVSTSVIDRIFAEYDFERIKSISYFSKNADTFSEFDNKRIKEVYTWYEYVSKHSKVHAKKISFSEFNALINTAKHDYKVAENLCQKIQGLKVMYFFVKNEKNISIIMNKMINGAKKISSDNGFFIKIY